MTHASLFSGIGGPEVAAAMLGWRNVFHCDINPFGRAVLDYWFPDSESYGDIKKTDFSKWGGQVDVLTGGFPCQPFSYAGQRRGSDDDRYLWPQFKRVIEEIQPSWVIGENVAGITTMVEQGEIAPMASQAALFDEGDGVRGYRCEQPFTIERVCSDFESLGYEVQPILIPACAVGAPHRRDRVFIIGRRVIADAYGGHDGRGTGEDESEGREERIQERDKVRQSCESSEIRPEGATISENTLCGRQLYGQDEVEGSERNIGNVGAGGGERICGETSRTTSADTSDAGLEATRAEQPTAGTTRSGSRPMESGTSADTRSIDVEGSDDNGIYSKDGRLTPDALAALHCAADEGLWGFCGQRWENFPLVPAIHRGNDGLPFDVDRLTLSFGKWRTESLKAYGNAIVPQVMYEIFRAIENIIKQ